MRIVFWQNCITPHQMPYITQLLYDKRVDEVIVISDKELISSRRKMGWKNNSVQNSDSFKVYIHPKNTLIEYILSEKSEETWHLFSGINAFPYISLVFKMSLKYNVKRGLITERPYTFAFGCSNGKPLWLHRLRFFFQDQKYAKYIDKVFAMGDDAVKYFKSVYNGWSVTPFIYCTDFQYVVNKRTKANVNFCFVGSLSCRKSPKCIVKAADMLHENVNITYIGGGEEEGKIRKFIANRQNLKVQILGFQNMNKIPVLLAEQDVLILPSSYDGWGAVVNEALQAGLYVICSDKCGAKDLLCNSLCGSVFESGNIVDLSKKMKYCIDNINEIRNTCQHRITWAKERISGSVIASYMVDCLEGIVVKEPWKI